MRVSIPPSSLIISSNESQAVKKYPKRVRLVSNMESVSPMLVLGGMTRS